MFSNETVTVGAVTNIYKTIIMEKRNENQEAG